MEVTVRKSFRSIFRKLSLHRIISLILLWIQWSLFCKEIKKAWFRENWDDAIVCKALDEIVVSCSLNCEWISDCYNLEAARKSVAEVRPTFQSLKSLEIVCFKWGWLLVYFLDTDVVPTDCISDCILSGKFQFLYSTFFGDCETNWIWRLALPSFISLEKPV